MFDPARLSALRFAVTGPHFPFLQTERSRDLGLLTFYTGRCFALAIGFDLAFDLLSPTRPREGILSA